MWGMLLWWFLWWQWSRSWVDRGCGQWWVVGVGLGGLGGGEVVSGGFLIMCFGRRWLVGVVPMLPQLRERVFAGKIVMTWWLAVVAT